MLSTITLYMLILFNRPARGGVATLRDFGNKEDSDDEEDDDDVQKYYAGGEKRYFHF